MDIKGIIALASLPIPMLAVVFWHARAYSLYRLLGERARSRGGYLWFAFELQSPNIAQLYPGYVDIFSSLPDDLAAQVSLVRRDIRRAEIALMCWMALIPILIGLGARR